MKLIERLQSLVASSKADELHDLQPLFERGLWMFGPEYDAVDFHSNRYLATIIRDSLGQQVAHRRPDFVALPDRSIGIYSAAFYEDRGEISGIRQILVVELNGEEGLEGATYGNRITIVPIASHVRSSRSRFRSHTETVFGRHLCAPHALSATRRRATIQRDRYLRNKMCRSCGFDFSVNLTRERPAPRINAVMAIEDAYISAVQGRAPDPQWLSEISSTDFRKLVESLVTLFSSRLPSETHILAVFLLDREFAERYHFCRHAAESKLAYFSWHWRFAVNFSIAKVIFGKRGDPTRSAVRPDTAEVFFELLRNLPWEDHFHIILASRTWPERLQDEFEVAMKRLERRAWASKRNPAA